MFIPSPCPAPTPALHPPPLRALPGLSLAVYYIISIPLGAVLAFKANMGLAGLWYAHMTWDLERYM
jgi:hypothetical protein